MKFSISYNLEDKVILTQANSKTHHIIESKMNYFNSRLSCLLKLKIFLEKLFLFPFNVYSSADFNPTWKTFRLISNPTRTMMRRLIDGDFSGI